MLKIKEKLKRFWPIRTLKSSGSACTSMRVDAEGNPKWIVMIADMDSFIEEFGTVPPGVPYDDEILRKSERVILAKAINILLERSMKSRGL